MYFEACTKCLGIGYIVGADRFNSNSDKIKKVCNKCKGEKILKYKTPPQKRKYLKDRDARIRVQIPVRWTPPEKIQEEYDYED
tara:strand:+ start:266 stop:514 length:249 start_codon:yes stop_codon:yes gene_type:complete